MNRFIGLEVENLTSDGQHRLLLSGELEIASVPILEGAITRLCEEGTRGITLDLSELLFIDSTGVAAIILAGKVCEKHGYDFALIPGSRPVQRIFELAGLLDVLPFRHDDENATLSRETHSNED
jgi:anti-sigma B factor antagonist